MVTGRKDAGKAFERALERELAEVINETKNIAARIKVASELWNLERWLTQRHLEIERKYDYRYSVLPFVLGTLLREGRLSERDLNGLDPEKFELIRRVASLDV